MELVDPSSFSLFRAIPACTMIYVILYAPENIEI